MAGNQNSGRKPAPTALKVVRGDRPSRVNQHEPKPEPSAECPAAPEFLEQAEAELWDRYAPMLHAQAVLTDWDQEALAAFCQAAVLARLSAATLHEEGITTENQNGMPIKHPAFAVWKESASLIRSFASEFGMTPASRSRLVVTPKPAHAADEVKAGAILS
jgi:P27 family predicted phage terminase small subunit